MPTEIKINNLTYQLKKIIGMWFFQLDGHSSGWTACSKEFVAIIENNEK